MNKVLLPVLFSIFLFISSVGQASSKNLAESYENCFHWAGEGGEGDTDPKRAKEIEAGMKRDCGIAAETAKKSYSEKRSAADSGYILLIVNLTDIARSFWADKIRKLCAESQSFFTTGPKSSDPDAQSAYELECKKNSSGAAPKTKKELLSRAAIIGFAFSNLEERLWAEPNCGINASEVRTVKDYFRKSALVVAEEGKAKSGINTSCERMQPLQEDRNKFAKYGKGKSRSEAVARCIYSVNYQDGETVFSYDLTFWLDATLKPISGTFSCVNIP